MDTYYIKHLYQSLELGIDSDVYEADESYFKRKYSKGRQFIRSQWVFCLIEHSGGFQKIILIPVEKWDKEILSELICQFVSPNCVMLLPDQWKDYCSLKERGYEQQTMNHSKHFIRPLEIATKQKQKIKRKITYNKAIQIRITKSIQIIKGLIVISYIAKLLKVVGATLRLDFKFQNDREKIISWIYINHSCFFLIRYFIKKSINNNQRIYISIKFYTGQTQSSNNKENEDNNTFSLQTINDFENFIQKIQNKQSLFTRQFNLNYYFQDQTLLCKILQKVVVYLLKDYYQVWTQTLLDVSKNFKKIQNFNFITNQCYVIIHLLPLRNKLFL